MTFKDFIGKEVIAVDSRKHYIITHIDGVEISVRDIRPNQYGTYPTYCWKTGTAPYDNAIAKGRLVFVDSGLIKSFKEVYEKYRNKEGRMDQYFYYSAKYD